MPSPIPPMLSRPRTHELGAAPLLLAATALVLGTACNKLMPQSKLDRTISKIEKDPNAPKSAKELRAEQRKTRRKEKERAKAEARAKADAARFEKALQASKGKDLLFEAEGEAAQGGVLDSLSRLDPNDAGWRTEALYELASHELEGFMDLLVEPKGHARLDWYLTTDFQGSTVLAPDPLETVFDDGTMLVRRPASIDAELYDAETLESLAGALTARFEVNERTKIQGKAKIFTSDIDPTYPKKFITNAIVQLDGETETDMFCQVNAQWRIRWGVEGPAETEAVRIETLELVSYEEILSQTRIFAEITDHVLGELPRYGEEFLLGCGQYHFRTDSLDGNVFSGQIGIAVGDVNGDGRDDLFVPQHGGLPNRLLLRRSDGTVSDGSSAANLDLLDDCQSALVLDLDNDGDQDIAIARSNSVLIAVNDGGGVFEYQRQVLASGSGKVTSLAAADWDADGDLDIYACVYDKRGPLGTVPVPYHDAANGPPNVAWRNDGDGRWSEVTEELGLTENDSKFTFAAIWEDFDQDGDLDLYVVNDFGKNNFYRNEDGRFRDVADEIGAADMAAGMGVTAEDVDGDGWTDLYVTNMWSSAGRRVAAQTSQFRDGQDQELHSEFLRHARGNTLLMNNGDGTFRDATEGSSAMNAGWAWGAIAVDLNNDGLSDLYSPNGFLSGEVKDDL